MADRRLPSRIFPKSFNGKNLKVLPYNKLLWIEKVVGWLDQPQLQRLHASQFGRLFDFPLQYTFSGTLVHFLLSRMLNTEEPNQLWFIFAGKPWRFSIREYAIATGLKCTDLPPKNRKGKAKCGYWDTLFPDQKSVSVTWMIKTLNSGRIKDPDMKLRYVALFLADCFLCAKSHETLITEESVELVQDIDEFLAYPWGTLSFGLTVKSIKKKIKYLDRKQTLALQGFLFLLQIVAFMAIPAIPGTLMEPLALAGDDETNVQQASLCLRLSKVKELEDEVEIDVFAMIEGEVPDGYDPPAQYEEMVDKNVCYMVRLIDNDQDFDDDMWGDELRKVKHEKQSPDSKGHKRKTSKIKKASSKSSHKESLHSTSSEDDESCDNTRKRKRAHIAPSSSAPSSESENSYGSEPVREKNKFSKESRKKVQKIRAQPLSHVDESGPKVSSSLSSGFLQKKIQRSIAAVAKEIKTHISLSISDLEAQWESRHDKRFEDMEKLLMQQILPSISQPLSAPNDVVPKEKRKIKETADKPVMTTEGTRRLTRSIAKTMSTSPLSHSNSSKNVKAKVLQNKRSAALQVESLSASTNSSFLPPTNENQPNPIGYSKEGNDKEIYNPSAFNVLADAGQLDQDHLAAAPQIADKTVNDMPNIIGIALDVSKDNGPVDEDHLHAAAQLHNETVDVEPRPLAEQVHDESAKLLLNFSDTQTSDNGTHVNSTNVSSTRTLLQDVVPPKATTLSLTPTSNADSEKNKDQIASGEDKVQSSTAMNPIEKSIHVSSNDEIASQKRRRYQEARTMMSNFQVADQPPRSPISEQKRRGRKRKTGEELPIVAPNGSARRIMILFLKFSSQETMPSRDEITSTFSAFGPLDFPETHISEESSSAEIAFVSNGDAVEALKSLKEASPFGETLVSFRLQPKVISVPGTKAPVISNFCPVWNLINTPATTVDSMRQNLFLMTEMLEKSEDRVPRETKENLKSDITTLLEKISSMPSSSSSS